MTSNDAATGTLGERLVQAGSDAIASFYDQLGMVSYRADVRLALAAMLPLLVEAIEAARDEHEQNATNQAPTARAIRIVRAAGMDAANDVIRSAAEAVSR